MIIEGLLVDTEDEHLLSEYKWRPVRQRYTTYVQAHGPVVDGRETNLRLHRLIMSAPPGVHVDHRNHNGLDNQRSNLRLASVSQNHGNTRIRQGGTSRFKGVYRDRGRWVAGIIEDGARRNLGRFLVEEDAARAYDAAARRIFGEFALTNFEPPT